METTELFTKATGAMKAALSGFRGELDGVRAKIAALEVERNEVETAPPPVEETLALLDAAIKAQADEYERQVNLGPILAPEPKPSALDLLPTSFNRGTLQTMGLGAAGVTAPMTSQTLCFYFGDVIRGRLGEVIKRRLAGVKTYSAAGRVKRLAEIDGELLDLAFREEGLVEEAEANGFQVVRRPDADPRAVLNVRDGPRPAEAA